MSSNTQWWRRILDWESEQAEVTASYPGAAFTAVEGRGVWRVHMRPIPRADRIHSVLADLQAEVTIRILESGELGHSTSCQTEHGRPATLTTPLRPRTYTVLLEYPPSPFGAAGPIHPRARVIPRSVAARGLAPEISLATRPGHPHLFFDRRGDSWACPLPPNDTSWTWENGATVAYLDQVAIWIVKSEVWSVTGQWLGPALSHAPEQVLTTIPPAAPCRCGSGAEYRHCHQPGDARDWVGRRSGDREGRTLSNPLRVEPS